MTPDFQFRPVPEEYLQALQTVQAKAGVPVFLAGGALRDTMHGVPIKDLDFFLTFTRDAYARIQTAFALHDRFQYVPAGIADYTTMHEVRAVLGYVVNGLEVNIIFLQEHVPASLHDVIARCDFGICQIGCDITGRLHTTDAFMVDVSNKTFTNTRFGDEPRARKRFERLSLKYPGYRLVNEYGPEDTIRTP